MSVMQSVSKGTLWEIKIFQESLRADIWVFQSSFTLKLIFQCKALATPLSSKIFDAADVTKAL